MLSLKVLPACANLFLLVLVLEASCFRGRRRERGQFGYAICVHLWLNPLGSTGDPPVPTGDPPAGTAGRVRTYPDGWFQTNLRSVPLGQWPNGTGKLPVPPIPFPRLGGTGDPPVPTGDPPAGTGGRVRTHPDGWFQTNLRSVPLGQWPNGMGKLPVPPIPFRSSGQSFIPLPGYVYENTKPDKIVLAQSQKHTNNHIIAP